MTAPRYFHQAVAAAKAGIGKGDSVTRPTADIVADLHAVIAEIPTMARLSDTAPRWLPILAKAADRLAELDALRPDCPTCGGTKWIGGPIPDDYAACPDCLDGKVSVAQLAATWRAVWDDEPMTIAPFGRNMGAIIDATLRRLRQVKP